MYTEWNKDKDNNNNPFPKIEKLYIDVSTSLTTNLKLHCQMENKGKDLSKYENDHYKINNIMNKSLIKFLLETISFIHDKDIIYSDIQEENILFDNDNDKYYLINFGISFHKDNKYCPRGGVTYPYVLPFKYRKKICEFDPSYKKSIFNFKFLHDKKNCIYLIYGNLECLFITF